MPAGAIHLGQSAWHYVIPVQSVFAGFGLRTQSAVTRLLRCSGARQSARGYEPDKHCPAGTVVPVRHDRLRTRGGRLHDVRPLGWF